MKTLLLAIQTRLREIEGLRDADVFLSADKDLVPAGVKFPCIGIKDGDVRVEHRAGEVNELTLPVEIYVYEQLIKVDVNIVALHDLAESVQDQLAAPLPGSYVKDVDHGNESAIMLLYREGGMLMRKTVFYQYIKED